MLLLPLFMLPQLLRRWLPFLRHVPAPAPVTANVPIRKAKVTAKVAKSDLAKVAAQRAKETLDELEQISPLTTK